MGRSEAAQPVSWVVELKSMSPGNKRWEDVFGKQAELSSIKF